MDGDQKLTEIRDVLPRICHFLNVKDLCSLEASCHKFYDAVTIELNRRCSFQVYVVDIKKYLRHEMEDSPRLAINHLDKLRIKPRLSVIFTNNVPSYILSVNDEIMKSFKFTLPIQNRTVLIKALDVKLNFKTIDAINNHAIGLFFSENRGTQICTKGLDDYEIECGVRYSKEFHRNVMEELFHPKWIKADSNTDNDNEDDNRNFYRNTDDDEPCALFVFNLKTHYDREEDVRLEMNFYQDIHKWIEERCVKSKKPFSLFGCYVRQPMQPCRGIESIYEASWFAATIFGKNIKSWSIPINLQDSDELVMSKLMKFKNSIKPGKENLILVLQSSTGSSFCSKIKIFSKFFRNVQVITLQVDNETPKLCVDTTMLHTWYNSDNDDQRCPNDLNVVYDRNYVCINVITWL